MLNITWRGKETRKSILVGAEVCLSFSELIYASMPLCHRMKAKLPTPLQRFAVSCDQSCDIHRIAIYKWAHLFIALRFLRILSISECPHQYFADSAFYSASLHIFDSFEYGSVWIKSKSTARNLLIYE
jgi:hypothetical protein